jgi:two-component system sensor histidine kinase RegB
MAPYQHERIGNPAADSPSGIVFSWLLLLRWGAVTCQALLILAVYLVFDIKVPFPVVSCILLFQIASNLYFFYLKRRRTIHDWLINAVMFLDVGLLTVLLYSTGGPMNPFTFLFLVHIVLGAIVMRPRWSWGLAFFAVFCYAGFFYPSLAGETGLLDFNTDQQSAAACHELALSQQDQEEHLQIHLQGMWFAFSLTAFFIVFFVGKIQRALEDHQSIVAKLQGEKVRNEKLASLATLAAGAAHEFSTPLSTIAVASGEMLHALKGREGDPQLLEDVMLIREQVQICKEIIFQMAADAGEHMGEAFEEFTLQQLAHDAEQAFAAEEPSASVSVRVESGDLRVSVPHRTFVRTIKGLLKNGFDASPPGAAISLSCRIDNDSLIFAIEDKGAGMDAETLAKAGEPFFSRKASGQGLGLGLYLAKSFAEKLGGDLEISSEKGQGTTVVLRLALKYLNPGT